MDNAPGPHRADALIEALMHFACIITITSQLIMI